MASFLVELDEKEMSRLADALDVQGGQRITIMRELIRAYSEAVEEQGALSLPFAIATSPKVSDHHGTYKRRQKPKRQ